MYMYAYRNVKNTFYTSNTYNFTIDNLDSSTQFV